MRKIAEAELILVGNGIRETAPLLGLRLEPFQAELDAQRAGRGPGRERLRRPPRAVRSRDRPCCIGSRSIGRPSGQAHARGLFQAFGRMATWAQASL